ncbi:uncharacterized protein LOC127780062 [Oryza glaberrima]|uniref:uncharacterized protein LOC127780062 n=1 Tax=Oryza glaberrima TaxID=4538 RepID=UPI00224C4AAC|nr:uncharacterized protein LOC127780062 [Oryza glaberrima]
MATAAATAVAEKHSEEAGVGVALSVASPFAAVAAMLPPVLSALPTCYHRSRPPLLPRRRAHQRLVLTRLITGGGGGAPGSSSGLPFKIRAVDAFRETVLVEGADAMGKL